MREAYMYLGGRGACSQPIRYILASFPATGHVFVIVTFTEIFYCLLLLPIVLTQSFRSHRLKAPSDDNTFAHDSLRCSSGGGGGVGRNLTESCATG